MAKKKTDEEGEKTEGAEAKPKSKKKMLIIIIAAVLVLGGGGAFFLLGGKKDGDDPSKQAEQVHPAVLKKIKLDPFIVNLSEAKSFLKVSILLEYDADLLTKETAQAAGSGHGGGGGGEEGKAAEGGFPPEIAEKEPVIRDKILGLLASKTPSDVLSTTGKQALKDEIIETVNEVLEFPEPIIVGVYFTDFMIQ